jgi:LEA14-like dessication related protein
VQPRAAGEPQARGVNARERALARIATQGLPGTMKRKPISREVRAMSFFHVLLSGRSARPVLSLVAMLLAVVSLGGCAGMFGHDPLRVSVAGVEPLASEGLEMSFNMTLRIQNPNETALDFDGVSVDLQLNGKSFASGVSDQHGSVPRYGETLVNVPLTVPAFTALRQAFSLAGSDTPVGQFPYILRGRLAGGLTGGTRFIDQGTLSLPGFGLAGQ